ncbi:MAG: dihydroneopterin triphosphate diphosphatase [Gammaproteobacteria bacterium]
MDEGRLFKRPESVLVVVYTVRSDVLLMRRRRPAAFWQSVTGSMRWDEADPLVTARREVQEETGLGGDLAIVDQHILNRFPIKPAWKHRYAPNVRHNLEHVLSLELAERVPVVLNAHEHSEYVWLARPEALEKVTSYTNRDAILRFVPVH